MMSDETNYEWINDLLDGRLTGSELAAAQLRIEQDAQAAHLLETFRANRNQLQALPKLKLEEEFSSQLMEQIQRTSIAPAASQPPTSQKAADPETPANSINPSGPARQSNSNFLRVAAAVATIAALLLVGMFIFNGGKGFSNPVAMTESIDANKTADEKMVADETAPSPSIAAGMDDSPAAKKIVSENHDFDHAGGAESAETFNQRSAKPERTLNEMSEEISGDANHSRSIKKSESGKSGNDLEQQMAKNALEHPESELLKRKADSPESAPFPADSEQVIELYASVQFRKSGGRENAVDKSPLHTVGDSAEAANSRAGSDPATATPELELMKSLLNESGFVENLSAASFQGNGTKRHSENKNSESDNNRENRSEQSQEISISNSQVFVIEAPMSVIAEVLQRTRQDAELRLSFADTDDLMSAEMLDDANERRVASATEPASAKEDMEILRPNVAAKTNPKDRPDESKSDDESADRSAGKADASRSPAGFDAKDASPKTGSKAGPESVEGKVSPSKGAAPPSSEAQEMTEQAGESADQGITAPGQQKGIEEEYSLDSPDKQRSETNRQAKLKYNRVENLTKALIDRFESANSSAPVEGAEAIAQTLRDQSIAELDLATDELSRLRKDRRIVRLYIRVDSPTPSEPAAEPAAIEAEADDKR